MREAGFWERRDIQQMICRSPDAFFGELGESIHVVGSEIEPTEFVQDRIDLLGVDETGAAVVIELKRDNHKLHLLQALSYAGMVAKWEPRKFIEALQDFNGRWAAEQEKRSQTTGDAKEELEEFLAEGDAETINRNQRIILLAEAFDYEVLVTCEWLTEKFGLDIRCYRLALAKRGGDEFLSCTRAYPPPELTDIAIRRRRKIEVGETGSTDWSQEIKKIQNPAIASFFSKEVESGRKSSVKYRAINFYLGDRRRFIVYAKRRFSRVYQVGRFDKDIEFWSARLGPETKVAEINYGQSLAFHLFTSADVGNFKKAVESELLDVEFSRGGEDAVESD